MKTLSLSLLGLITVLLISCEIIKDCPDCFTPPQELILKITDSTVGADLIFNNTINPDSVKFFYFENEQKIILNLETFLDSVNKKAIFFCYDVSWKSPQGIKDFYLYLGNSDIDTIYLDIEKRNSDCCTYYEWIDFSINDKKIALDSIDYVYNYIKTVTKEQE